MRVKYSRSLTAPSPGESGAFRSPRTGPRSALRNRVPTARSSLSCLVRRSPPKSWRTRSSAPEAFPVSRPCRCSMPCGTREASSWEARQATASTRTPFALSRLRGRPADRCSAPARACTRSTPSAGGSTVDLEGHGPLDDGEEAASSYHRIYIAPGSRLAATVGSGGFVRVNSRHLRGLREAHRSPDLMASAYSLEDGVIEALESPDGPWTIGVQFHPERRAELPPHFGRLFEALVERSRHPRDREK